MKPQVRHAYLAVAVGGMLGSLTRAVALGWLPSDGWPWGLLVVNVAGSAILAFLLVWGEQSFSGHPRFHHLWRPFMATGVMGGFTTTSAFATQAIALSSDSANAAFGFIAGSVLLGIAAYAISHALSVHFLHRARPA